MAQENTISVLLVDDEERNLDALEAILDDPSYRLLRASDADTALRLLLENDVAAIVLDIKMPGVSGFELAQMIKGTKKFRQIPIVFLTAYLVDDKDVITGYGAGAVDYLTKPVNPQILRHKVAVFADLFRKTRALAELNEKLETRVRERTAELEEASRLKDEFLAMMSHELRTPLNAMLGWTAILRRDSADPEKVQRGLEVIERNAQAQARIVNDLLDVSRIVSGKLRLVVRRVQMATVIQSAAEVVRPAADAKGVELVLDLDPDLGVTRGDPDRLRQIIWNVLSNAVRFTPSKGRVVATARRQGSAIVVRVEDNGAGIAAEHLPYIFERFRQVDSSTTRVHGGLGLGLAIVRHLVEAHGGSVSATSEGQGRGATFTLVFPVRAAELEATEGSIAPDSSTTDHGGAELERVHVLLVEDDPDALEMIRIILEDAGAHVTAATDGRAALEAPGAFDVIVSDIGMPEMDGYALIRRLRSRASTEGVPALALTAYARPEDAEQAAQAGFQAHLSKPVEPHRLVEVVRTILAEGREAPAALRARKTGSAST